MVQEALARGKELLLHSLPSLIGFGLAWLSLSLLLGSRAGGRARSSRGDVHWEDGEEWEEEEEEEEEE